MGTFFFLWNSRLIRLSAAVPSINGVRAIARIFGEETALTAPATTFTRRAALSRDRENGVFQKKVVFLVNGEPISFFGRQLRRITYLAGWLDNQSTRPRYR